MVWVPDSVMFTVATAWQVPSRGGFRAARARGAVTCPVPPCAMETVAPPAAVCPKAAASCAPDPFPTPVILLVPIAIAPDMVPPDRARLAACAAAWAVAAAPAASYRKSVWDSGRSPDWTSQIPELYCMLTPCDASVSVPVVTPRATLNTSLPEQLNVVLNAPETASCLMPMTVFAAGALGSVTVTLPVLVSVRTYSPALAV